MQLFIIRSLLIILLLISDNLYNYSYASNTISPTLTININTTDHKDLQPNSIAEIIKKNLLLYQAASEKKLTKHRIDVLYERTPKEILENLQGLGYYHSKIIHKSLIEEQANQWIANYKLTIGDPILIKTIDLQLTGINENLLKKIKNSLHKIIFINKKLVHDDYEKAKQTILTELHNAGFLSAQFTTSKIAIKLEEYSANILFKIDLKEQYYFGPISFESDLYNEKFLYQYLPFKEKDLYSNTALMQLKNNLLSSGLFDKVRIDTTDVSTINGNIIPIKVRVYAKSANKYSASMGFGTDTGIRGTLGYSRIRKSYPGHTISVNLLAAKIRKQIAANYVFLHENPLTNKYSFGITATEGRIKERFNRNTELYIQKSKKQSNKKQFWKINFLMEKFKELPNSKIKKVHYLMPNINIFWTNITQTTDLNNDDDNYIAKENNEQNSIMLYGNRINLITKIATKYLASSANIMQFIINEKWIQPFFCHTALTLKGIVGTTFIKDFNKLPISLRFFAGGDDSVRGFSYNSLGPYAKDLSGNIGVIGGKNLFLISLELEKIVPRKPELSIIWFIDSGNSLNTFKRLSLKKLATGTGIGAAYRTPIGAIKSYLAKPIKHLEFEDARNKNFRLHLTFTADL